MVSSENLVWMDLEMTGLDPKENKIIEIEYKNYINGESVDVE